MPALTVEHVDALAELYRTTHNVRLRTRTQMVLLATEQQLGVREIAASVRECEGTVRCWLKRYSAHGTLGLQDLWAGGAPVKVTPAYREQLLQLVRRRPRSLDLPLFYLDSATAGRRAGRADRDPGAETNRAGPSQSRLDRVESAPTHD
jgi:transposase